VVLGEEGGEGGWGGEGVGLEVGGGGHFCEWAADGQGKDAFGEEHVLCCKVFGSATRCALVRLKEGWMSKRRVDASSRASDAFGTIVRHTWIIWRHSQVSVVRTSTLDVAILSCLGEEDYVWPSR
jgi:hypothetical protein